MTLDKTLLDILICPVCKAKLSQPDDVTLQCNDCKKSYPIVDGIPNLLVEPTETS